MSDGETPTKQMDLMLYEQPAAIIRQTQDTWASIVQGLSSILQQNLTPAELALFHDFTEKSKKSIDAFKEIARDRLLSQVKSSGIRATDKGTLVLDLGNGNVQRAIPVSTKPKDKLVEAMLKRKGLLRDSWMDKTIIYTASESKLAELLDGKLITTDEYNSCFAEQTYRVGKSQPKGEDYDD